MIIISKPNVLTLHILPPASSSSSCTAGLPRGGGVVSYHAFSRKLGGLVRDPGRPFYPDICRMKTPSFFMGFCGSNLIKTSKTAIRRGSRAGSRFPLAVPFERGATFHHADRMWGSANTVNMQ